MKLENIPSVFADDDTVYHYTKTETALEHILFDKRLRISQMKNSIDPIENREIIIIPNSNRNSTFSVPGLGREVENIVANSKQVSFCKNSLLIKGLEKFGFAKPRMWDQYGDSYKGVCLAFSEKELKKATKQLSCIHHDDVKYLTYEELDRNKMIFLNVDRYEEIGVEKYKISFLRRVLCKHFYKHKDYEGENEFRICSFSKMNNEYLDISDSLVGVMVSANGLNKFLIDSLAKSLEIFDREIPLMVIQFSQGEFFIYTYEEYKNQERIIDNINRNSDKLWGRK